MDIMFGIEIECGIDIDRCFDYDDDDTYFSDSFYGDNILVQNYHDGRFTENRMGGVWKAEHDSSLEFDDYIKNCEFISKAFSNRTELQEGLRALDEDVDLSSIYINDTCGAHIHFSMKDYMGNKYISYKHLRKIRDRYYTWLKNYDEGMYNSFYANYDREYACVLTPETSDKLNYLGVAGSNDTDRHREFFYTTNNTGIEWRSFNLAGCQTLEDIEDRVLAAYDIISEVMEEVRRKKGYGLVQNCKKTIDSEFIKRTAEPRVVTSKSIVSCNTENFIPACTIREINTWQAVVTIPNSIFSLKDVELEEGI